MPLSTEHYGYIIDPFFSFMDEKGKTIKNGSLRVFLAGSSTPAVTYLNWAGAMNEETIQLDNSGRCYTRVIGAKDTLYKVCVYDLHHSQETPIITVDNVQAISSNADVVDGSVTTQKIADEAVTAAKIHESAVTTLKIADGAVTESKLSAELKLKAIKDYVTPEMFGAVGDGITDDSDAFISMLNSDNGNYYLANHYRIEANITFAIGKFIMFGNDSKLIPASDKTITINCEFEADNHAIFDFSEGGVVDKFRSITPYNICHFSGNSFTDKWNNLRVTLVKNRKYSLVVPMAERDMEGVTEISSGRYGWNIDGPIYFNNNENQATWFCNDTFVVTQAMQSAFIFGNLAVSDVTEKPEVIEFPLGLEILAKAACTNLIDIYSVARLRIQRLYMDGLNMVDVGLNLVSRAASGVGQIFIENLYGAEFKKSYLVIGTPNSNSKCANIKFGVITTENFDTNETPNVVSIYGRVEEIEFDDIFYASPDYKISNVVTIETGVDDSGKNIVPRNISFRNIVLNDSMASGATIFKTERTLNGINAVMDNISVIAVLDFLRTSGLTTFDINYVNEFQIDYMRPEQKLIIGSESNPVRVNKLCGSTLVDNANRITQTGPCVRSNAIKSRIETASMNARIPLGAFCADGNLLFLKFGTSGTVANDYRRILTAPYDSEDGGETRPTMPSGKNVGFCFYDKTLTKPIWWTGSGWVDATGSSV